MFLRDGRTVYVVAALAGGVVWLGLVSLYGKYTAQLGGVNVIVWVVVIGLLLAAVLSRTSWFRQGKGSSRTMLRIALIGFGLIALLGILATEPPLREVRNPTPAVTTAGVSTSREIATEVAGRSVGRTVSRATDFDFDVGDDECAGVILLIAVVVLLLLAVTVPNFWVVGCGVMVSVLTLIAWRELAVAARVKGEPEPNLPPPDGAPGAAVKTGGDAA